MRKTGGRQSTLGGACTIMVTMPYRRRMSRRSAPRAIIKTYKKVLNFALASHGAGTKINFDFAIGIDSVSNNQGSPTDATTPTGNIIDYIEIQYGVVNLAAAACFIHVSLQSRRSGQSTTVPPNLVGGDDQRNQVYHQEMRSIGQNQNATFVMKWKIPKMIQRVREGDVLSLVILATTAVTDSCQMIFKMKS